MTSSGQDASWPLQVIIPAGSAPTLRSRTTGLDNQTALRLIGQAVVNQMLRSRRFYERMAVGALVQGAPAWIGGSPPRPIRCGRRPES
jgi:hypothetical protein